MPQFYVELVVEQRRSVLVDAASREEAARFAELGYGRISDQTDDAYSAVDAWQEDDADTLPLLPEPPDLTKEVHFGTVSQHWQR